MAGLIVETLERPGGVDEDPATCMHCQLAIKLEELSKLPRYQRTDEKGVHVDGTRLVDEIMLAVSEFLASMSPERAKVINAATHASMALLRHTAESHGFLHQLGKFNDWPKEGELNGKPGG